MRLVECVPNFSDGQNEKVINAISDAIRSVQGVSLLDVDPGWSTNRTVITFVGSPEVIVEGAFQAIKTAQGLIDMRKHKGEHPRMGATDVCPFVPVSGVTMEECVKLAGKLGERVGKELGIPVYLYAEAAKTEDRQSLAEIRKGEYEALPEKMKDKSFKPDFGPAQFNPQSGATVIGARQFLIAYNVNLNTRSKKLANDIALTIREAGKAKRDAEGNIVKDKDGVSVKQPGTLKAVRAVGWYVDEYKRAQISINLIDYAICSLHQAFDEAERVANEMGLRVTGSEIVGLVPLEPMLEAGRHYLRKQGRSTGVSERELVETAVQSLGLAELSPFDIDKKIIEYRVAPQSKELKKMSLSDFVDELASDSVAPGGGSAAALAGALSASLSAMVGNLTYEKKGFEKSKALLNDLAERGQFLKSEFLRDVDNDMNAYNRIIEARRLPKATPEEMAARDNAMHEANLEATMVPLRVLKRCEDALELVDTAIKKGNPNSLSDAGVAGLMALAAAEGAYYNVLINLSGFDEKHSDVARALAKQAHAAIDSVRKKSHRAAEYVQEHLLKESKQAVAK
ncbi:MAG: glutamate formimidoyltransferase [Candidatus Melainabacteria bacterium]|nr:glutamate formimidoyltransferase [Candidatus Melainabacteria bacterium]